MRQKTAGPDLAAELRQELKDTVLALRSAYDRFNYVCEAELVESSVYEIKSLQARYSYLLRAVKELDGRSPPQDTAVAAVAGKEDSSCLS